MSRNTHANYRLKTRISPKVDTELIEFMVRGNYAVHLGKGRFKDTDAYLVQFTDTPNILVIWENTGDGRVVTAMEFTPKTKRYHAELLRRILPKKSKTIVYNRRRR